VQAGPVEEAHVQSPESCPCSGDAYCTGCDEHTVAASFHAMHPSASVA